MWNPIKNDTEELIQKANRIRNRKKLKDFKTKLMVTKGDMLRGKDGLEIGISIYALLYAKPIINKELLYSSGENLFNTL